MAFYLVLSASTLLPILAIIPGYTSSDSTRISSLAYRLKQALLAKVSKEDRPTKESALRLKVMGPVAKKFALGLAMVSLSTHSKSPMCAST
jgi:hypothetical protein